MTRPRSIPYLTPMQRWALWRVAYGADLTPVSRPFGPGGRGVLKVYADGKDITPHVKALRLARCIAWPEARFPLCITRHGATTLWTPAPRPPRRAAAGR